VTLRELVEECWAPQEERAQERRLRVELEIEPSLALHTDREKARIVLSNLLDNAVSHAAAGGRISIVSFSRDGVAGVRIQNTASPLGAGDVHRVFDRFWRADAARGATGVHCGLGLSLSKELVGLLGGTISVESAADGTFSVTLSLATLL
jgi:signal transduction histidine kinase